MDLLSIDSLTDGQIATILDRAERWFADNRAADRRASRLTGRIVFNLFYENSTRTAMSFATAAHRLGAVGDLALGRAFLGEEGRDAGGHGADAERDAARCAGHPPPRERRAGGRRR